MPTNQPNDGHDRDNCTDEILGTFHVEKCPVHYFGGESMASNGLNAFYPSVSMHTSLRCGIGLYGKVR